MNDFLGVLLLTALPAFGNFLGGLLSEAVDVSRRVLSLALHGAAGIVLAVVGIELIPTAFETEREWVVIGAFVLGGGFYVAIDILIERLQERVIRRNVSGVGVTMPLVDEAALTDAARPGTQTDSSAWAIFFGVAVDLFSDGVAIGAGSSLDFGLGLLLALGQIPGDLPEGFATIAAFKEQGIKRRTRLLLSASFLIPIVLGASFSYLVLRGQPQIYKLSLLAFTAGILLTVAVEEIVPEAHREGDARLATFCFVGGFALFALLSAYLR